MPNDMPRESDWKHFRSLKDVALDRFCQGALDELARFAVDDGTRSHDRYLKAFRLIEKRDKTLAHAFEGISRSSLLKKMVTIRSYELLTEEEFAGFSAEFRDEVDTLIKILSA